MSRGESLRFPIVIARSAVGADVQGHWTSAEMDGEEHRSQGQWGNRNFKLSFAFVLSEVWLLCQLF